MKYNLQLLAKYDDDDDDTLLTDSTDIIKQVYWKSINRRGSGVMDTKGTIQAPESSAIAKQLYYYWVLCSNYCMRTATAHGLL